MKAKYLLFVVLKSVNVFLQSSNCIAQGGAAINSTGAVAVNSAMLDVSSTTQGIRIPRVALSSTTSASPITNPVNSLLVYDTVAVNDVTPGFYYWDTIPTTHHWVRLISGSAVSSVSGTFPISVATGTSTPAISIAANSQASAGVVTAGGSNNSMVWKTDASGNPSWSADANSGGTVTSVSGTSPISVATGTSTPVISITSPLPIANGGTSGTTTPTAGAVAYGTGSAYAFSAAGTDQQVLISKGASSPIWTNTITNLNAPINPNDAATKAYVDAATGGGITQLSADQCASGCLWATCRNACEALNTGGVTGWHIPSLEEVESYSNGAMTGQTWITALIWTANTYTSRLYGNSGNCSYPCYVNYNGKNVIREDTGDSSTAIPTSESEHCRCVK
ncbi:MAG: hypothetical protein HGB12_02515 [Bacteroidetes bacterium]|nr:hypothetical protein [Bacteroidota bacterium]